MKSILKTHIFLIYIFCNQCCIHGIADWIGLRLADCVFPAFLFIMGVAISLSIKPASVQTPTTGGILSFYFLPLLLFHLLSFCIDAGYRERKRRVCVMGTMNLVETHTMRRSFSDRAASGAPVPDRSRSELFRCGQRGPLQSRLSRPHNGVSLSLSPSLHIYIRMVPVQLLCTPVGQNLIDIFPRQHSWFFL